MGNDSKLKQATDALVANREAIRAAADGMARASTEFLISLADYDRRLKRDGLWPGRDVEWVVKS